MFEQRFETMLQQYQDAIDDKKRFSALIKDIFPDQTKNINLLLMAYNLGIAQDMQNAGKINNTFAFRFVKQLMDDYGLSRSNADWIVSVWCVCYGKHVLEKECDLVLQEKGKGPAVKEESVSTRNYGDLFQYKKSANGNGLMVCGFSGTERKTIIFQNRASNQPVIEIGSSVFQDELVEEAILTEGYRFIGSEAFAGCSKLHQIILPDSIVEIGDRALKGCIALKSIVLPGALERIGNGTFKNTGLKTIKIPKSIYWIGDEAFMGCENMEEISIPSNISRLPKNIFESCIRLKKVILNDAIEEIDDRAFAGCSSLDIITIPDSVKRIGENVFIQTDKRFIIQCSFGSYAEEYARKNKIKYQLV